MPPHFLCILFQSYIATVHTAAFWNITIQWTSHDDLTKFQESPDQIRQNLVSVKSQSAVMSFCPLTVFLFGIIILKRLFGDKCSNQSGGQTHGWILLKKRIYYNTFYSICCRLSPFHREWLALTKIIMI